MEITMFLPSVSVGIVQNIFISVRKFKRQQFSNMWHLLISFCRCISCCTYIIQNKNVNISKKEKHVASFDEVVETRFCCSVNVIVSRWVSSEAPLSLFRLLRAVGTCTVADYRQSTVRLQLKTLLPCILDLTPAIEVIYYLDYRKCFLKYRHFLISIVDYLLFRGQFLQQSILL